jgi:hypothetical protein
MAVVAVVGPEVVVHQVLVVMVVVEMVKFITLT